MKTVIVFQGGGALGAFGAGAWQVLATATPLQDASIIAVAGASIGAINAAMVAHRYDQPDKGAGELAALWQQQIATPPWPFFFGWPGWPVPPTGGRAADWNGFMTGLLLGSRGLNRAQWPVWQPLSGMSRLRRPLHQRGAMLSLLESRFPAWASADRRRPMLAVGAVDFMAGTLRVFDSDSAAVTARELAASTAIPLLFEPVEVDGRLYWDGEVTRDSLLPPLLQRLLDGGRVARGEPVQLITIEQFTRASAAVPASDAEIIFRALCLLQADKLRLPRIEGLNVQHWRRVQRAPLPEDGVSGQFDYSPSRIERLIAQGRAAAEQALAHDAEVEGGARP